MSTPETETTFTLIGITVSVHYEDYLSFCLTNAQVLDHWYVVVDPTDKPTIEMLQNIPNVTLIHFDFQKGGYVFNKSGGIYTAQKLVHATYPHAWVLLVDSDIVLPLDLRQKLLESNLNPEGLHGAARAFYQTPQQLLEDKPVSTKDRGCWGFFHLYYDKTKFCPESSKDAARYDDKFKAIFGHHRTRVLPIMVKHLGDEACNWKGRKSKRFEIVKS
jgi:hypothetical protein